MNAAKRQAVLTAVEEMKAAGVSGIKLELEASTGRTSMGRPDSCGDCDEDYEIRCETCDSSGALTCPVCDGDNDDCEDCDDYGEVQCQDCDGRGYTDCECQNEPDRVDWTSETQCLRWILNRVAEKTNTTVNGDVNDYSMNNPFDWMRYAKFYNDGSVDSEITFTVKLDNPENIFYVQSVVETFKELGYAIGERFVTTGAGMHTAVLFSPDASYPSTGNIDVEKRRNFTKAMHQLLPALYFLSSPDGTTRSLSYRMPQIGRSGDVPKYSAIYIVGGAFEYRSFDTCYDSPETVFDNIVVIANTLKYYSEEYISPGVKEALKKDALRFGADGNNRLDRLYCNADHLLALEKGLEAIKPSYYSLEELREQRGFTRSYEKADEIEKDEERSAKLAYREYSDRFNWKLKFKKQAITARLSERILNDMKKSDLEKLTQRELTAMIKETLAIELDRERERKLKETDYVKETLETFKRNSRGSNTIYL